MRHIDMSRDTAEYIVDLIDVHLAGNNYGYGYIFSIVNLQEGRDAIAKAFGITIKYDNKP